MPTEPLEDEEILYSVHDWLNVTNQTTKLFHFVQLLSSGKRFLYKTSQSSIRILRCDAPNIVVTLFSQSRNTFAQLSLRAEVLDHQHIRKQITCSLECHLNH